MKSFLDALKTESLIDKRNAAAYLLSGLSFFNQFNFRQCVGAVLIMISGLSRQEHPMASSETG